MLRALYTFPANPSHKCSLIKDCFGGYSNVNGIATDGVTFFLRNEQLLVKLGTKIKYKFLDLIGIVVWK